jgi:SulP family sulfate permease
VASEVGPEANVGGLVIYRFDAPLFFGNANLFTEEVERLVGDDTSIRWFVLDAQALTDVDMAGAEAFEELLELLSDRNVTFAVSRASEPVRTLLERYGFLERIGTEHFFPTNRHAWAAFKEAGGGVPSPSSAPQNPESQEIRPPRPPGE